MKAKLNRFAPKTTNKTKSFKKQFTSFRVQVRSRHPSHEPLRTELPRFPFRSVVRLGSTTELPDVISNGGRRIECNTVDAIENTSNKVKMKQIFAESKIKSPAFLVPKTDEEALAWSKDKYPIITKTHNHSRGRGMDKVDSEEGMKTWLKSNNERSHIFEEFINFAREYRLHVSQNGCFYSFRKLRKEDAKDRWYFNSSNCAWIIDSNPLFDRPKCWGKIVDECKKALSALKLDIGGFDVRVNKDGTDFTIIEANSACSFGDITTKKYISEISKILQDKYLETKKFA